MHGFFSVQNCSKSFLRDATDGKTQFRQGMARKTEASTDFGPAARHAATIIHIDLEPCLTIGMNISDSLKGDFSKSRSFKRPKMAASSPLGDISNITQEDDSFFGIGYSL